jgi:hypothetical protein
MYYKGVKTDIGRSGHASLSGGIGLDSKVEENDGVAKEEKRSKRESSMPAKQETRNKAEEIVLETERERGNMLKGREAKTSPQIVVLPRQ